MPIRVYKTQHNPATPILTLLSQAVLIIGVCTVYATIRYSLYSYIREWLTSSCYLFLSLWFGPWVVSSVIKINTMAIRERELQGREVLYNMRSFGNGRLHLCVSDMALKCFPFYIKWSFGNGRLHLHVFGLALKCFTCFMIWEALSTGGCVHFSLVWLLKVSPTL